MLNLPSRFRLYHGQKQFVIWKDSEFQFRQQSTSSQKCVYLSNIVHGGSGQLVIHRLSRSDQQPLMHSGLMTGHFVQSCHQQTILRSICLELAIPTVPKFLLIVVANYPQSTASSLQSQLTTKHKCQFSSCLLVTIHTSCRRKTFAINHSPL